MADALQTLLQLVSGQQPMTAMPATPPSLMPRLTPGAPALTGTPGLPDARIAQAFETALQAKQQPQPRLTVQRGEAATGAPMDLLSGGEDAQAAPRLQQGGGGIRNFLGDVAAGVGQDPNAGQVGAFARGFSGAMGSAQSRAAAAEERRMAEEDRALKREQAGREDRRLDMADKRAAMEDERAARTEKRQERQDQRAGRRDEFLNLLTATEIWDKSKDTGLTVPNVLEIERQVGEFAKTQLGMSSDAYRRRYPDGRPEDKQAIEAFRQELTNRALGSLPGGSAPAGTGGNAPAPQKGAGTEQDPYTGVSDRAAFESLPSGAYFIDESTGTPRLLRKK